MATVILLRHGENEWVKKNRLAGWLPGVHLNERGQQQAREVADRLADLPIKAVYSSPVARCLETAVHTAEQHGLEVVPLADVGEVRYGEWEGQKIKKLTKNPLWRVVQFFPSRMRFPEGEALREVQYRAVQALERLSEAHGDDIVVVTSHADVIKLVLAHYLGIHIDLFQRIAVSPASVSVITLTAQGMMRVLRINDDGPLKFTPPPKKKAKKTAKGMASASEHSPVVEPEPDTR